MTIGERYADLYAYVTATWGGAGSGSPPGADVDVQRVLVVRAARPRFMESVDDLVLHVLSEDCSSRPHESCEQSLQLELGLLKLHGWTRALDNTYAGVHDRPCP